MKQFVMIGALLVGGVAVFGIADTLSSDALGMMLGMFFGVCAGIPAALIVMAASRGSAGRLPERRAAAPVPAPIPQPTMPVILFAGGNQPSPSGQIPAFWNLAELQGRQTGTGNAAARQFRVVGDADELVDEW